MEDKLVSFETAKLAKEKGFDEPCSYYYACKFGNHFKDLDGNLYSFDVKDDNGKVIGYQKIRNQKSQPHIVIAPTQSLLQKWLREKYNIIVVVNCLEVSDKKLLQKKNISIDDKWTGYVWYQNREKYFKATGFKSYEEALEAGLQEALKLIENV